MHRKVAAALVAVLALALAGCGGSEQTSLTRAELVRRVEQACREGQREGVRAARAAGSEGQRAFIDAALASQKTVLDRIDGYTTSGAAQRDFEAFKDSVQTRVDAVERIAEADRADVQRAISAAQRGFESAASRAAAAARNLGIEGCL